MILIPGRDSISAAQGTPPELMADEIRQARINLKLIANDHRRPAREVIEIVELDSILTGEVAMPPGGSEEVRRRLRKLAAGPREKGGPIVDTMHQRPDDKAAGQRSDCR